MAASLSIRPSSPTTGSVCHVDVTGATVVDSTTYSTTKYPTMDPIVYVIRASDGATTLRSFPFTPNADGAFTFDNLIFPNAGTWTLDLLDTRNEASAVATLNVVVS